MNFHKRPCVRDSQLQGLAAGFAGGSLAAILGSKNGYSLGMEVWLKRGRTRTYIVKLGRSNMVRCIRRVISSLPILPEQRESRDQASPGPHGEEADVHRSEEGSAEKGTRGARQTGTSETDRGGEEEVLGILVREERQVLVTRRPVREASFH
jgi:hypothetical protein